MQVDGDHERAEQAGGEDDVEVLPAAPCDVQAGNALGGKHGVSGGAQVEAEQVRDGEESVADIGLAQSERLPVAGQARRPKGDRAHRGQYRAGAGPAHHRFESAGDQQADRDHEDDLRLQRCRQGEGDAGREHLIPPAQPPGDRHQRDHQERRLAVIEGLHYRP